MNKIYILYKDYEDYMLRASKDNPVRKFWMKMVLGAPKELRRELSEKRTDLKQQEEGKFDITGALPYQFEAEEASEELKNYLKDFVVFVEHNSEEVLQWKEEIKTGSYLKYEFLQQLAS